MVAYTPEEQRVLNYFFTNLDKPIFAAKNFHPEVWALMQARYSRSQKGMREGFLELLKEDPENFAKLSSAIANGNEVQMQNAIGKAIEFMEKWVLGYGHASVAEGAVVGIGLEGVSILATKFIEDNRLCSYTEKSTRYVSFNKGSFYFDKTLKESQYGSDVQNIVNDLFDTYEQLSPVVLDYVKRKAPLKEGENEAAWTRACGARRFDSVRYLLPAGTMTSFGWTVNARALAYGISKLLSHPLQELRDIGEETRVEGRKVLPSLLKYANENNYFSETQSAMEKLTPSLVSFEKTQSAPITLVNGPQNADNVLIAAILYRYSHQPFKQLLEIVGKMEQGQKQKVLDEYLSRQGEFDYPLREVEHLQFTIDILMDYGAFRDIQRHRIMTQTNQLLTTFHGYDTPPDITGAGVQPEFDKVMKQANELFTKLQPLYPWQAQYIVPMAYRKRVLISANLRELHHFIKLRSTRQGHYSYRMIAQQMYAILKEKYPFVVQYLVCHLTDDELGRLKAEQKLEEKIKQGVL
ncbi:MAG: FAD-dependent thymidylate synthase [Candidatus Micrarchaeota archaeon]